MRTFFQALRIVSAVTLFFFCWTFLPLRQVAAYAAQQKSGVRSQESGGKNQGSGVKGQKQQGQGSSSKGQERPEERFEKTLDDIREKVAKAEEKTLKNQDVTAEVAEVKARRAEIDSLDVDLKKEFAATEKKLKDANLPKEILDRHYKFVKHYKDNLKELKANLDTIEKQPAKSHELRAALQKTKAHLEKVKPPKKHIRLDPNKLPHRMVKAKARAPRLKKEDFEKDFPPQKRQSTARTANLNHKDTKSLRSSSSLRDFVVNDLFAANELEWTRIKHKPILLAFNGLTSDIPFQLPLPAAGEGWGLPSNASIGGEGGTPSFDTLSATNYEPRAILLAQATVTPPTADDLVETLEVQFTQDINDLAAQLNHSPVKIYEWVRNNIEFVPTYGNIQGADMCLQTKQCNSIDTASLLIALLRISNRPARYVYGTIEVPIDKLMNWAGGFTNPVAAANFLASGGIPIRTVIAGGKITRVQMEHAWVETYIPYGNYRGAVMDQSIKAWIPMDGSFKQYTYTNGFDITGAVQFNQDEYLGQVQSQNAVHYYQSQIQTYLDANMPDTPIVDVKGYREITQEIYHFLPSTLPYITVAQLGKFSSIPDGMTAKATFMVSSLATGADVSYTASMPELAGKRITVSYTPATVNDEVLITAYGGFLYNVPAYMLNLKPVLRIEGAIKLTGDATTLGSEQTLTLQFTQPGSTNEMVNKKLLAGACYAIGMDLQGINENVLGKRNYQLNVNILSQTVGTLGKDDLIGEHLFILATTYFLANDKIQKSGAKLFNVVMARTISESITSFTLTVSHLFSIPKSAMPLGINMDVAMAGVVVSAKDGDASKERAYMDIHGLVGSYHEHDIFEKIDGFSSVSAVKALQTAYASGIPIAHINATNIGQILSTLQVSPEIKTDIQNAVNAGKDITISQANVQINDWNGVGYIIKDPITGAGSYMISGGLAGSDSTSEQDGMRIVEIHKDPGGWVKDNVDPQTRNTIVMTATENIGDFAAGISENMVGMPYDEVDCAHLARISYWSAGICLDYDPDQPLSGCTYRNSLTGRHHIGPVDANGALLYYNLADHLKAYEGKGIRTTNDPLIGDMVFFNYGTRVGHVGIVVSAPNDEGTIQVIDSTGTIGDPHSRGVQSRIMNIAINNCDENKPPLTKRKASDPAPPACCTNCTAAHWFVGFGTVRDVSCSDPTHN